MIDVSWGHLPHGHPWAAEQFARVKTLQLVGRQGQRAYTQAVPPNVWLPVTIAFGRVLDVAAVQLLGEDGESLIEWDVGHTFSDGETLHIENPWWRGRLPAAS